ncbi:conserved hypothetical protein [Ricinus communis]|uniref:Uncharacterized protein n=1 Tax=Ricinus communis TaxID=3988 RepID=B9SCN6_RICCO|nr:conserved hypothetical protein [Ricinus communis]
MLRLNRLFKYTNSPARTSILSSQKHQQQKDEIFDPLPSHHFFQKRFLDIYQLGNKEAIEKERARLADEMNRGYFADIAELKQHGGKIAMANKIIIPAMAAVKFPNLEVNYSDGKTLKLPIGSSGNAVDANTSSNPKVSLLCLSFRASSQSLFHCKQDDYAYNF